MTNADTIREALQRVHCVDDHGYVHAGNDAAALAALDALVAERDEVVRLRLESIQLLTDRYEAAEAELKAWKVRAVEWEKRARAAEEKRCDFAHELERARLREALGEYREKQRQCALDPYVQKRRTHDNVSFHDGYFNGRMGAVTDLDAALAGSLREDA